MDAVTTRTINKVLEPKDYMEKSKIITRLTDELAQLDQNFLALRKEYEARKADMRNQRKLLWGQIKIGSAPEQVECQVVVDGDKEFVIYGEDILEERTIEVAQTAEPAKQAPLPKAAPEESTTKTFGGLLKQQEASHTL